jgi:hypothetical protein
MPDSIAVAGGPGSLELTPEEKEALERDPNAVALMIARAEKAYMEADDATRPEAEKRYDRALSLAALLQRRLSDVVPSREELERRERYPARAAKLLQELEENGVPAEERQRRLAEDKERYFEGRRNP